MFVYGDEPISFALTVSSINFTNSRSYNITINPLLGAGGGNDDDADKAIVIVDGESNIVFWGAIPASGTDTGAGT